MYIYKNYKYIFVYVNVFFLTNADEAFIISCSHLSVLKQLFNSLLILHVKLDYTKSCLDGI